jgi:plastocyanin
MTKVSKGIPIMSLFRSSLSAAAATCFFGALGCGGAEPVPATAPNDPGALAAVASPVLPCVPCSNAEAPAASAVPASAAPAQVASAVLSASAPPAGASAAPSASEPAPTFDASKPRHLLQGVVTGPSGKPAANTVVYLPEAPTESGRGEKATLDQHNMLFVPYVLAVAVGGSITFANSDPFPHNVYSTDNEKFNLGMISQHGLRTRTFKQTGAYRLLCNLHPNMIAYAYVSPSSYFAVTTGQGKYLIKDVPEGSHKVAVWAVGASAEPQVVTVGGTDATLDLSLHK